MDDSVPAAVRGGAVTERKADGRRQLALVLLTLVALSVLPFLTQNRIDRLRDEINSGADPSLANLATITTEVALEAAARRGYLLTRDEQIASTVGASRVRRQAAMEQMDRRSRSLSPAVDSARERFFTRLQGVDVQLDSLFAQGASRQQYIADYDEREARFTAALKSADSLRTAINKAADERRAAITSTEDLDALLTGALTLLGLAAAVAAARLASGMRAAALAAEARRAEVERVTESRARLIRGFTHDVRNPLGAADGHLALLEEGIRGELAAPQHDSVVKARRSIRVAIDLIAQLLELARAEAGQLAQRSEPFDLRDVVSEVADEFMASAEAKRLTVAINLSPSLPTAVSDSGRVRQVVANIVSNAVKYTPDGGRIEIRTLTAENPQAIGPGNWIGVEVADTGRGISADHLKILFHEFTRFDPTAAQGSGIGLAISERIARALGGRITVESTVGEGSRFSFWLPVRRERRAT